MPVSGNAFLHWLTPRRLMAASAAVACAAIALKALAWQLTGSVGLLSDALESVVNLAGAGFGLLMLTVASRPADEGHPYGHYKAEYFASAFEGLLILAAAAAIAWAALPRLAQSQSVGSWGWEGRLIMLTMQFMSGIWSPSLTHFWWGCSSHIDESEAVTVGRS